MGNVGRVGRRGTHLSTCHVHFPVERKPPRLLLCSAHDAGAVTQELSPRTAKCAPATRGYSLESASAVTAAMSHDSSTTGPQKPCWQKPCWQTCTHGLRGYVGSHARVACARLRFRFLWTLTSNCVDVQVHGLHGCVGAITRVAPVIQLCYFCQHGFCQHGFHSPEHDSGMFIAMACGKVVG